MLTTSVTATNSRSGAKPDSGGAYRSIPDHATDDLSRLAADLDLLLQRRPSTLPPNVIWTQPSTAQLADRAEADGEDADFEWLADGRLPEHASAAKAPGDTSAGWIGKAKQERRSGRLRSAFSWVVTVCVGGAIVSLSAYLLLGRLPGIEDIAGFSQRLWL